VPRSQCIRATIYPGPSPAKVVTTPADVILRMVLFELSPTYMLPDCQSRLRKRWRTRGAPSASALPYAPAVPAKVVTTAAEVTFRMV